MDRADDRIREAEQRLFTLSGAQVAERFVTVKPGGSPLRLRVLESGSGSPVLLLHPAGWFAAQWASLLPHVHGRRLLCLDFPGHGLSDAVDYRMQPPREHTVAMLRELLAALSLRSVAVVGNSLGGMAALWLAIAEPRRVSRVVVLGLPGSVLPGSRPDLAIALMSLPGLNRLLLRLPSSPSGSKRLLAGALGPTAASRLPPEVFEIHHLASRRAAFALTLSTFMQATLRWRTPRDHVVLSDAELGQIHPPTLFLWGEGDIYGGPEIGERAVKVMPDAVLRVRPGGHFPQFDDPAGCGQEIDAFLR